MVEFIQGSCTVRGHHECFESAFTAAWVLYMAKDGSLHEAPTHAEGQISLPLWGCKTFREKIELIVNINSIKIIKNERGIPWWRHTPQIALATSKIWLSI